MQHYKGTMNTSFIIFRESTQKDIKYFIDEDLTGIYEAKSNWADHAEDQSLNLPYQL